MKIILHWLILAVAVYILPNFLPGIHVATFLVAVVVGAVLGFINAIIKPVISLLTLPINILTLGLFSFVLNGLFFYFVAKVITGFTVDTFKAACIGALIVAIISWLGNKIIRD